MDGKIRNTRVIKAVKKYFWDRMRVGAGKRVASLRPNVNFKLTLYKPSITYIDSVNISEV